MCRFILTVCDLYRIRVPPDTVYIKRERLINERVSECDFYPSVYSPYRLIHHVVNGFRLRHLFTSQPCMSNLLQLYRDAFPKPIASRKYARAGKGTHFNVIAVNSAVLPLYLEL